MKQTTNKLSSYDKKGGEVLDKTPIEMPVGFKRPKPIQDKIRELVNNALIMKELSEAGLESFEEADDFDIPDETYDPTTPFEENFDNLHTTSREQEIRGGMVEEFPIDKKERANATIRKFRETKSQRNGHRPIKRSQGANRSKDTAITTTDGMDEAGPESSGSDDQG